MPSSASKRTIDEAGTPRKGEAAMRRSAWEVKLGGPRRRRARWLKPRALVLRSVQVSATLYASSHLHGLEGVSAVMMAQACGTAPAADRRRDRGVRRMRFPRGHDAPHSEAAGVNEVRSFACSDRRACSLKKRASSQSGTARKPTDSAREPGDPGGRARRVGARTLASDA